MSGARWPRRVSVASDGVLSGKYTRQNTGRIKPDRGFIADTFLTERTYAIVDELDFIAKAHESTVARVALAWVQAQAGVTSTIVGARRLAQLGTDRRRPCTGRRAGSRPRTVVLRCLDCRRGSGSGLPGIVQRRSAARPEIWRSEGRESVSSRSWIVRRLRPALNWVKIANGLGVEVSRAETCERFGSVCKSAMTVSGPRLIEVAL
jgi:hypothetical protein